MKIEVDYKTFETVAKTLSQRLGVEGLESRIKGLEKALADIQKAWVDEQNKSQIVAIKSRIDDLIKLKDETTQYMYVMQTANNSYKKVVKNNINIANSL